MPTSNARGPGADLETPEGNASSRNSTQLDSTLGVHSSPSASTDPRLAVGMLQGKEICGSGPRLPVVVQVDALLVRHPHLCEQFDGDCCPSAARVIFGSVPTAKARRCDCLQGVAPGQISNNASLWHLPIDPVRAAFAEMVTAQEDPRSLKRIFVSRSFFPSRSMGTSSAWKCSFHWLRLLPRFNHSSHGNQENVMPGVDMCHTCRALFDNSRQGHNYIGHGTVRGLSSGAQYRHICSPSARHAIGNTR